MVILRIKASLEFNSYHSIKGSKLNKLMSNGHASAWCAASNDKDPWI